MQNLMMEVVAQLARAEGEVRRLFHGRGGCFPGYEWLAIDWLPPVAVIRVYAEAAPMPLQELVQLLAAQPAVNGVVVQYRGRGRQARTEIVAGEVAEALVVQEAGLSYRVRPLQNQNAGLFLDMRRGRAWVRAHAAGAPGAEPVCLQLRFFGGGHGRRGRGGGQCGYELRCAGAGAGKPPPESVADESGQLYGAGSVALLEPGCASPDPMIWW